MVHPRPASDLHTQSLCVWGVPVTPCKVALGAPRQPAFLVQARATEQLGSVQGPLLLALRVSEWRTEELAWSSSHESSHHFENKEIIRGVHTSRFGALRPGELRTCPTKMVDGLAVHTMFTK